MARIICRAVFGIPHTDRHSDSVTSDESWKNQLWQNATVIMGLFMKLIIIMANANAITLT